MSATAKAILVGRIAPEQIESVIHPLSDDGRVQTHTTATPHYIQMTLRHLGGRSTIDVFGDQEMGDDRDVYDGERTLVHMGASRSADMVLKRLLETFGGFLLRNDGDGSEWVQIGTSRDAPDLRPLDRLRMDLGTITTPHGSGLIAGLATDPERLDAMIAALEAYREATSSRTPSP